MLNYRFSFSAPHEMAFSVLWAIVGEWPSQIAIIIATVEPGKANLFA